LLINAIGSALETIKDEAETQTPATEHSQPTIGSQPSVHQVVKQYFSEKNYKYQDDEKNKRFIFGFATNSYIDPEGDSNIGIVINYSDDSLLRIETPRLYMFDLNKTEYSLICMAIAWFQFEYKFLSMSLDPSDGELKISIDIPVAKGTLHSSQIDRIVQFILQFTEVTYDELFSLLLSDSNAAKKQLNEKIDKHKMKVKSHSWVESIKEKLSELTDEQKDAIEHILAQGNSTNQQGGI